MTTSRHFCNWPGCRKTVKHEIWGCYTHWMQLPANLRAEIWRTYRAEIEQQGVPGPAYVKAAYKVQDWIKNHLREMRLKKATQLQLPDPD